MVRIDVRSRDKRNQGVQNELDPDSAVLIYLSRKQRTEIVTYQSDRNIMEKISESG